MSLSYVALATAPIGYTEMRINGTSAPAQYVPTFKVQTSTNKDLSNTNVKVDGEYPVPVTNSSVTTYPNAFRIKFQFTALRSVIAAEERAAFLDEFVAWISKPANKTAILNGSAIVTL